MMSNETSQDQHHSNHHVSSPAQLVGIFVTLLALTGITIAAAEFPFGEWDVWIALLIAGAKAFLVAAYFMHLKYDNPFNAALLVFSILIVVLFLGVTLSDAVQVAAE